MALILLVITDSIVANPMAGSKLPANFNDVKINGGNASTITLTVELAPAHSIPNIVPQTKNNINVEFAYNLNLKKFPFEPLF